MAFSIALEKEGSNAMRILLKKRKSMSSDSKPQTNFVTEYDNGPDSFELLGSNS